MAEANRAAEYGDLLLGWEAMIIGELTTWEYNSTVCMSSWLMSIVPEAADHRTIRM